MAKLPKRMTKEQHKRIAFLLWQAEKNIQEIANTIWPIYGVTSIVGKIVDKVFYGNSWNPLNKLAYYMENHWENEYPDEWDNRPSPYRKDWSEKSDTLVTEVTDD